MLRFFLIDY